MTLPNQSDMLYPFQLLTCTALHLQHLRHQLTAGAKALDVGSGSGYLTACMAMMVGEEGLVIGVEHIPELVDLSKRNITKGNADLLKSKRVKIMGESQSCSDIAFLVRHLIWIQLLTDEWAIRQRRRTTRFTSEQPVPHFPST